MSGRRLFPRASDTETITNHTSRTNHVCIETPKRKENIIPKRIFEKKKKDDRNIKNFF